MEPSAEPTNAAQGPDLPQRSRESENNSAMAEDSKAIAVGEKTTNYEDGNPTFKKNSYISYIYLFICRRISIPNS